MTGLGNGVIEESMTQDIFGNVTTSTTTMDRDSHTQTRTVDTPDSTINAVTKSAYGLATSSTSKDGLEYTFAYDALGRRISATDPRIGESRTFYDDKGRVESVRDAAGNVTHFYYDEQTGRKIADENSLGHFVRYAYNVRGQVVRQWGDGTYPVEYVYDAYGRKTAMHTFRTESGWDGEAWPTDPGAADVTTWVYDDATGLLTQKLDAQNKGASYTYTVDGKLQTRTWARKDSENQDLVTTYSYDPATGEMLGTDYSDSTPDIAFTYDRLGRKVTVTDGQGLRTFTFNATLQPESEVISGTVSATLTRAYDALGRGAGFSTDTGYAVAYGFDSFGRFENVGWSVDGSTGSAAYGYLADSGLLDHVSTDSGLITSYSYEDHRDVKTSVSNAFNTALVSSYIYEYDTIGRRTSVANTGSAFTEPGFNRFDYNDRSEVTGSHRYQGTDLADTSLPVDPETRLYAYDAIGNRQTATEGAETKTYTANDLNQYTIIANGAAVTLEYDADGNLVNKGGVAYTYNGENRLVAVAPASPAGGDTKVSFVYDYQGRRATKTVHQYSAGAWVEQSASAFLYDGWNLIQETITANGTTSIKQWVWGLDLSQTLDGAGGVGGLLAMMDDGGVYLYCYDANGNVGQLVNAADGSISAHYEYDAFGRTLKAQGPMAQENPFRFSTKSWDIETGLYYYGYRYLDVDLGRWVSRDPMEERAGICLYAFVDNGAIDGYDYLGLYLDIYFDNNGISREMSHDWDTPSGYEIGWIFNKIVNPCGNCDSLENRAIKATKRFQEVDRYRHYWATKYAAALERFNRFYKKRKNNMISNIPKSVRIERTKYKHYYEITKDASIVALWDAERAQRDAALCSNFCCDKRGVKGWYCIRGTAIISSILDTTSLTLAVSGAGISAASITWGLSSINNVVQVNICKPSADTLLSQAGTSMSFLAANGIISENSGPLGDLVSLYFGIKTLNPLAEDDWKRVN